MSWLLDEGDGGRDGLAGAASGIEAGRDGLGLQDLVQLLPDQPLGGFGPFSHRQQVLKAVLVIGGDLALLKKAPQGLGGFPMTADRQGAVGEFLIDAPVLDRLVHEEDILGRGQADPQQGDPVAFDEEAQGAAITGQQPEGFGTGRAECVGLEEFGEDHLIVLAQQDGQAPFLALGDMGLLIPAGHAGPQIVVLISALQLAGIPVRLGQVEAVASIRGIVPQGFLEEGGVAQGFFSLGQAPGSATFSRVVEDPDLGQETLLTLAGEAFEVFVNRSPPFPAIVADVDQRRQGIASHAVVPFHKVGQAGFQPGEDFRFRTDQFLVRVEKQEPIAAIGLNGQFHRLLTVDAKIDPGAGMHLAGQAQIHRQSLDKVQGAILGARIDDDEVIDDGPDRVQQAFDDRNLVLDDHVEADAGPALVGRGPGDLMIDCGRKGGHGREVGVIHDIPWNDGRERMKDLRGDVKASSMRGESGLAAGTSVPRANPQKASRAFLPAGKTPAGKNGLPSASLAESS